MSDASSATSWLSTRIVNLTSTVTSLSTDDMMVTLTSYIESGRTVFGATMT